MGAKPRLVYVPRALGITVPRSSTTVSWSPQYHTRTMASVQSPTLQVHIKIYRVPSYVSSREENLLRDNSKLHQTTNSYPISVYRHLGFRGPPGPRSVRVQAKIYTIQLRHVPWKQFHAPSGCFVSHGSSFPRGKLEISSLCGPNNFHPRTDTVIFHVSVLVQKESLKICRMNCRVN